MACNNLTYADEALVLQSQVAQLQRPCSRVLGAVRQLFTQNRIPALEGKAKYYLSSDHDLVALKPPGQDDWLSRYLRRKMSITVR